MTDFPVDDATLLAIEHALGGSLTYDRPEGAGPDDEGPWLVGADYTLGQLLDFIAGAYDPPDLHPSANPSLTLDGYAGDTPIYVDTRLHFHERDVIAALIKEVRRLRGETP